MKYFGDFAEDSTIRYPFNTTNSSGVAAATSSALASSDFRIYKDGSDNEKTTANGIAVSVVDSVTGAHRIEINTGNDTGDSGFWATGSDYFVMLKTAKTVDSTSLDGLFLFSFSIENRTVSGVANDVDALLVGYDLDGVDGKLNVLDAILDKLDSAMEADGAVYRFTQNALERAPSGSGSGGVQVVYTNPVQPSRLELVRGDAYDGTANTALTWTVSGKSYTTETVTLTIRSYDDDSVIVSVSGSASGDQVTVNLTSANTAIVPGIYKFDVEVGHPSDQKQTIARGDCVVQEDQTRAS